jgi:hypothetical protein
MNRVSLYPFADRLLPGLPPRHGMRQMGHIVRRLQQLPAGGPTSIDDALEQYVAHSRESGLVFLLGDMLAAGGYRRGIGRLQVRGDRVVVVQILDPDDLIPSAEGPLRLIDAESLDAIDLNVGQDVLTEYRRRMDAELVRLGQFLASLRIPHVVVTTDVPLEELLHRRLRVAGVLR